MGIAFRRNNNMTNGHNFINLKFFQKCVKLNDVSEVNKSINLSSTDRTFKLVNTQVNGKTCIDIATDTNVGLEIWTLLLENFDTNAVFDQKFQSTSLEQLLQSPFIPGNPISSVTPSHQIQKVELFLEKTCKVEHEIIKQLRLRYLCDLCRIEISWFF